ncbi:DUF2157 domain-containing protein [Myxococcus sp. K38C18041901]|uniref:DUF2157 domain-containing protein n=1 Tax=Myxococcus guangdongensis TaxID=2906760 RepID=UPI0020A739DF|nr:DUF2157 domain-containing protein [Myxococcus guangdongensis]MCP3058052.1 DUF2157 domain-containing protein [Myxococcus guangdongensis]
MPKDLLELDATPERLRALTEARVIPPEALERALALSTASPTPDAWRRFVSTVLLGLGALLLLSGVIYFFAYNWAEMHRFAKLGLIGVGILGTALLSRRLGDTLAGQCSLFASAVLVGAMLAVYGQAYQTGADAFELFVGWAALILPWVLAARFAPLWLLLLVLANTGIALFQDQVLGGGDDAKGWLAVVLGLLNGLAWATHEHFANRGVSWLQGRWLPRVLATMGVLPLLAVGTSFIIIPDEVGLSGLTALVLLLGTFAAEYALHRHLRGELFLLTLGALSVMTLVTTGLGRVVFEGTKDELGLFILPIFIIIQVAIAVSWLRAEARATGASEES